jgi:hypothetical protein
MRPEAPRRLAWGPDDELEPSKQPFLKHKQVRCPRRRVLDSPRSFGQLSRTPPARGAWETKKSFAAQVKGLTQVGLADLIPQSIGRRSRSRRTPPFPPTGPPQPMRRCEATVRAFTHVLGGWRIQLLRSARPAGRRGAVEDRRRSHLHLPGLDHDHRRAIACRDRPSGPAI